MTQNRDVVITGLGATTPLGGDVDATWRNALAGVSGAHTFTDDWASQYELPVTFGAHVAVPAEEVLTRPETKRLDPSGQFAIIAARQAWEDAGTPSVDPTRLGTVVASGIGGVWTLLNAWDTMKERGPRRVLPLTVPMLMPNSPAANVSIEFNAQAGAHTTVSACASGAEAIASATEMIRSGRADVVLAGGTEAAIHPLPMASFASMQALSRRNESPETASRPYDKTRDGFVMGEGAGMLVLESAEHAAARGARVYARVAGVGMTSDAHHIAAPESSGRGQTRAMQMALDDADIDAASVVHVNAHATSTPVGDGIEARGIRTLFGSHADDVVVTAPKSMMGHLLGAAGAVETILTVLSIQKRLVPATINVTDPDDDLDIDLVLGENRVLPSGQIAAINNSFGFGGHNVAVVATSV